MAEQCHLPAFPLSLLPLPGELVPLHIFEPRYRQLLNDLETNDLRFGIFCTHQLNEKRVGSVMKLESIIKRYPSGESDIVVRCQGIFSLEKLYRVFKEKLYPGADALIWDNLSEEMPDAEVYELFIDYQKKWNIHHHPSAYNMFQVASELNLDLFDRYKFVHHTPEKRKLFLKNHLLFQLRVIEAGEKSRDFYHLN